MGSASGARVRMRGSMRSTGGGGGGDQVQLKQLKRNTLSSRPLEMEVDDTASTSERQQLTPQTEPRSRPDALAYASTVIILLAVSAFIWLSFKSGVSLFSFHPTLMAVGVCFVHSYSLVYRFYVFCCNWEFGFILILFHM